MKLKRVTVTGADDAVDIQALADLSAEFPFVEWGILVSPTKIGVPRYPSFDWRSKFFWRQTETKQSLHLCGEFSRIALAGYPDWPGGLIYPRVQLNGFSRWRLPSLRFARLYEDHLGQTTEVILQVEDTRALQHAAELGRQHANVSALWDPSGGCGVVSNVMGVPWYQHLRMGWAGGLSPDNVVSTLKDLPEAEWTDMETGARTADNKFDLTKVRRYLELSAPFVVRT